MGATSWTSSMLVCKQSDRVSRKVTLGSAVAVETCREGRGSPERPPETLPSPL